jgi:hypothetical protein
VSNSFDPLEGISHISFAGIHVCYEELSIPWFNSMVLVDLNLKSDILDLNVARNKCLLNEKKHKFGDFIEISLLKCIKDFLDINKCERDFPRLAYAFMNTFIKFPSSPTKEYPIYDRLFLSKYYYLKKVNKNGISYINYDDRIFEADKKIILLTEVPLDFDLKNILPNVSRFKEENIYFAYTNNLYNLIFNFIGKRDNIELMPFCEF